MSSHRPEAEDRIRAFNVSFSGCHSELDCLASSSRNGIVPFLAVHHEGNSQTFDSISTGESRTRQRSQDDCLNFLTYPMLFDASKQSYSSLRTSYNFQVGLDEHS